MIIDRTKRRIGVRAGICQDRKQGIAVRLQPNDGFRDIFEPRRVGSNPMSRGVADVVIPQSRCLTKDQPENETLKSRT